MGRLVGYGVFNGVTVGLVGLWGARVGSQGAREGHGVLVWGLMRVFGGFLWGHRMLMGVMRGLMWSHGELL